MASSCIVPVVKLENVRLHPNADTLDICDVLGYQMCIPKGKHKSGDVCVYFPADTLISKEWADKFGVTKYLKGTNHDRVGCVRLRGEPSFGIIADLPKSVNWQVGDNVADYYAACKYEPPIQITQADQASYDADIDPYFVKYTDIENGRIFTDVFHNGEIVVVTEKIHGMNNRVGTVLGRFVAGSHTTRKKDIDASDYKTDRYWYPLSLTSVCRMLKYLEFLGRAVILYGEVYGRSVQSLGYGIEKGKGLGYAAFDISINGNYMNHGEFVDVCNRFQVPRVTALCQILYSLDFVKALADGESLIKGANHIREGIVVKPLVERTDPKVGRAILKYISTEYELGMYKEQDTTDV